MFKISPFAFRGAAALIGIAKNIEGIKPAVRKSLSQAIEIEGSDEAAK